MGGRVMGSGGLCVRGGLSARGGLGMRVGSAAALVAFLAPHNGTPMCPVGATAYPTCATNWWWSSWSRTAVASREGLRARGLCVRMLVCGLGGLCARAMVVPVRQGLEGLSARGL